MPALIARARLIAVPTAAASTKTCASCATSRGNDASSQDRSCWQAPQYSQMTAGGAPAS